MENKIEFINEMKEMNESLLTMKTDLQTALNRQEDLDQKIKLIEAEMMEVITDEVDDKGKPIFSNADKRNAEMKIRLAKDELYIQFKDEAKTLKKAIQELTLKIDHTSRNFKIYELLGYLSVK